ncbi:MAG TPA: HlyD family efflux transporter periplasmic adaptor subunit [Pirellulales bacterium]|nr:HlyD family efflux transporter periplasmic adaptor subunit [Pirellulales bacterium]
MNPITAQRELGANRLGNGFGGPVRRPQQGSWLKWVISFVGMLVLGVAGVVAYQRYFGTTAIDSFAGVQTAEVKRTDLLITVTEDGNVESAKNLELKCEVPGPITILEIVPDGSQVKEGDVLVRLDDSTLVDSILTQDIVKAKAEASKITAEKNHAAALIAVEEYREGTFVQEMQQLEADIIVARQNQSTAENQLQYSEKMHRKGFVTSLDVESKQFAVEQAKLNMAVAETKKEVLAKFTRQKMLEDLTSKRDGAEALAKAENDSFTQESRKLQRYEDQKAKCTIVAKHDGMVVYANDTSGARWGQSGPKIEQGAQVNQFQAIVRMPDLKNMQVKALVHETKVDRLRLGMRARIKIQDREFQGEIASIANQPEPTSWFSGSVKEYATIVKIDGEPEELKPGMTAEVEILVEDKKDVLTIPVQCIVENGGKFYSWVRTGGGAEPRELMLGGTNDTVFEIIDGLKEGEKVLLNPRADIPTASEGVAKAEKVDITQRFGASHAAVEAPATAPAPGGGPAAGGAGPGSPGAGGPATGGPGAGGRGGPGRGAQGWKMPTFKELDKDGDGSLTREENPSPFFDRIDADSSGAIDAKEFKEAMDRARKMMQQGGPGGGGPGGGGPGAGGPSGGGR